MLKILLLRSKIDAKRAELKAYDDKAAALEERAKALETRNAELEEAISELTAEQPEEDRAALEEQVAAYETDKAALNEETADNAKEKDSILREIEELENELAALEAKQAEPEAKPEERSEQKAATPEDDALNNTNNNKITRERVHTMNTRFRELGYSERSAIVAENAAQNFLNTVRESMEQKRSIGNVGLLLPDSFIEFVKAEVPEKSKLYKHLRVRRVKGNGRAVVMAAPVEAYWTELCANLKELELGFGRVPVTPHKVGAYVAVCNATLEMSDIDLAAEIIDALGDSIGYAYDKAVVFGDGNTMPLGIVTRLIQTAQPANYPADGVAWTDLHTTHVTNGVSNIASLIGALGNLSSKYSRGGKFWVMNEKTRSQLIANYLMGQDSNGRYVTGLFGEADELPVIGGKIEVLDFVPDGLIAGGFGGAYLLTESRDWKFSESEHAHFIEDETLFKATSYADGKPIIAEAFAAVSLGSDTVADLAEEVVFAS